MRKTATIILPVLAALALTGVLALQFQNEIALMRAKPAAQFDEALAPPPASYAARSAWALTPDDRNAGAADIFYVHSTAFLSDRSWNSPIGDPGIEAFLRREVMATQAAPFLGSGAVYAPYYRQATLFAFFDRGDAARDAMALAQRDIASAFDAFLAQRADPDRPFVLVGYGQGGVHALALLQRTIAPDDALRSHLAAAYLFGAGLPTAILLDDLKSVPPCAAANDTQCIISITPVAAADSHEADQARASALIWGPGDRPQIMIKPNLLCVPPDTISGLGACNEGLFVTGEDIFEPTALFRLQRDWPVTAPLNLTADILRRAVAVQDQLDQAATSLEPIGETVDLETSPINKVRE